MNTAVDLKVQQLEAVRQLAVLQAADSLEGMRAEWTISMSATVIYICIAKLGYFPKIYC